MELGRLFGFLHPALIHFPLVLLLAAFCLELVGFVRRDGRVAGAARLTLIVGAVATLFAFVCGNFAEIWAARDGVPQEPMEQHELYATITSWLFVFLAAARMYLRTANHRKWMPVYLTFLAAACILLVVTGHKGAMLVYHQGAGVQLGVPGPAPTNEDLAVLRQKQDTEALWYSDKMHHVFGCMVLIFSGLLLVELVSPKLGIRLRAVTPILLVVGGIFLMIWSDTDSWPLSGQRPITDKEVIMHKTYAGLMLIFGIQGLTRRKKRTTGIAGLPETHPSTIEAATVDNRQGRAMAVFSLIGGALLFTHVHSNAPYANVAVGVYLHHTVMGCIALCIGAVKLAGSAMPSQTSKSAVRALAWAYPCLMLAESIFLLNYNEGLPWFLGYGGLSLAAPHNGLIAPVGGARAELVFEPTTKRMDVYLLRHGSNSPYFIPDSEIQAIVRIGTEATLVPLKVVRENAENSHFAGIASFLDDVDMFQAQVLIKDLGQETRKVLTADFEPWTSDRLAAAHKSQAAYICPMHTSVGAGAPGRCNVCGMALVPNKTPRPWHKLHDDEYSMDLALSASKSPEPTGVVETTPRRRIPLSDSVGTNRRAASVERLVPRYPVLGFPAGTDLVRIEHPTVDRLTRLSLTPRRSDGSIVEQLETVHTKKLHLIVVSSDLSFFDHVHPMENRVGTLTLDYTFPAPGEYVLYSDCTPTGGRNQVFANHITVSGMTGPRAVLEPTPAQAKVFGEYRVRLDLSPEPPLPGDETQLTFTVSRNGVPVTDLEPLLGAGGHCVAISEDTRAYLHSHPLQMVGSRFGPKVTFHTVFPKPGIYKIWGQFLHDGKPLIADFVIRIP